MGMAHSTQKLREEIADEVLSVGVPFDLGPRVRAERRVPPSMVVMLALFLSGAAVAFAADRVMDSAAAPVATAAVTNPAPAASPPVADPLPITEAVPVTDSVVPATETSTDAVAEVTPTRRAPARRPRPAAGATPAETTPTTPTAPSAPAQRWDTGGQDAPQAMERSIDDLLDSALGGAPAQPVMTPTESLPETPTRSQVLTTLRSLEGEIRMCTEGADGVVDTRLVVDGATGRVTSVSVRGDFAGTAAGTCAARVVRTAHFPRFARERFEISFPYSV